MEGRNASSVVSDASVGPNTSILILSGLRAILSTFPVMGRQER
ncbi:hypothetical protein [Komagataeibacter xylinus]|nr:hypothetical protein [Komagataeibacter xylinus]